MTITPYDTSSPTDQQAKVLHGIDVIIATVDPQGLEDQKPLATAAKAAGVKRFVPSSFATVAPPKGVIDMREKVCIPFKPCNDHSFRCC